MTKKATKERQKRGVKKISGIDLHCPYHELVDPNKLKPHPANPNRHPEAQIDLLAKIIGEHGIRWPISVSRRSGFVASGHGRREAAIKLGLKKYPVIYQDFKSEAEELAVLVADNKIAELAETDGQAMAEIIVELDRVDYPLELTALNEIEIRQYIEGPTYPPDGQEYDENIETKNECPKCGYVW